MRILIPLREEEVELGKIFANCGRLYIPGITEARNLKFCTHTESRCSNENYAKLGHRGSRNLVLNFGTPLISQEWPKLETEMCRVCGELNAAVGKLLWSLVLHYIKTSYRRKAGTALMLTFLLSVQQEAKVIWQWLHRMTPDDIWTDRHHDQ